MINISRSRKVLRFPVVNEKSPNTMIIAISSFVIVIIVCLIGFFIFQKFYPANNQTIQAGINRTTVNEVKSKYPSNANNITISMPDEIIIQDNKKDGIVNVENVKQNKFDFTVTFVLDDGRTAIKTGVISPGNCLEKSPLLISLSNGKYKSTANYTTYDKDGVEVNKVCVAVTIIVG